MTDLLFLKPISIKNKIRIGPNTDGGYVLYAPVLDKTDVLLTFGVGWDAAFEIDFNKLTQKKVRMFDPTMKLNWQKIKELFRYVQYGQFQSLKVILSSMKNWYKCQNYLKKNDILFFEKGIAGFTNPDYDTFNNHLQFLELTDERILLKIDIEESEYQLFREPRFIDDLKNVNQLVIEFHNLKFRLRELKNILTQLKETFEIVHIHANNFSFPFTLFRDEKDDLYFPDVIELTLVKKDYINKDDILHEDIDYPVEELDYPNSSVRPNFYKLFFD